jgi:hypothetical protein
MTDITFIFHEVATCLIREDDFQTMHNLALCNKAAHKEAFYIIKKYCMNTILTETKLLLQSKYYGKPMNHITFNIKMLDFVKEIQSLSDVETFVKQNKDILISIKLLLNQLHSSTKNPSDKKSLLDVRNQTFNKCLDAYLNVAKTNHVTEIFNQFVKGITYFHDQELHDKTKPGPAYHRINSCPAAKTPNVICKESTSSEEKQSVETCYVERLIYDHIWTNMTSMPQNESHLLWLQDTEKAYSVCYPEHKIKLSIIYNDSHLTDDNVTRMQRDHVPTRLDLEFYVNANLKRHVVFVKEYGPTGYDEYVSCFMTRYLLDNTVEPEEYERKSTFEDPGTWTKVTK